MRIKEIRYTEAIIATLQSSLEDWYVGMLLDIPEKQVVFHRREVVGLKTTAQPLSIDTLTHEQRAHGERRKREEARRRAVEYDYPTDREWYRKRTLLAIANDLYITPYEALRHVTRFQYPYIQAKFFTKFQYPDDPEWYRTRTLDEMMHELRIPRQTMIAHLKRNNLTWKSE